LHAFLAFLEKRQNRDPVFWQYFDHLHRDWGWGDEENQRAVESILTLLPSGLRPGRVLVPGAGACRLAYDLHHALTPSLTVATDINPFLFLCAAAIGAGDTIALYEFPPHPRDLASYAVRRELHAPAGELRDGFYFVLTDIDDRCFLPGSFDCVVTSWFIDAAGVDIHRLFALINELLVKGGLWINLGPTMFADVPSRVYSVEEILEAIVPAGFSLEESWQRFERYLTSPASASQRVERLLGFRATKSGDAAVPPQATAEVVEGPAWLTDTSRPVNLKVSVRDFATAHQVTAEVLLQAEGELSLSEIVHRVANQFGLSHEVARAHAERTLRSVIGLTRQPGSVV
jgi:hypothetical protein